MKKNILPIFLIALSFNNACQTTIENNKPQKELVTSPKKEVTNVVSNDQIITSLLRPLEFDTIPNQSEQNNEVEKKKIKAYLQKNDIFATIPYNNPEKYKTDFTGDGTPVFISGKNTKVFNKGFTGDGTPVFSIKNNEDNNKISTKTYLWSRTLETNILDYLQLNNTVSKALGITTYSNYSQLGEYNIDVSGAFNNKKKVKLVKQVAFGLTQEKDSYKLYSISPLSIRRVEPKSFKYQIRSVTFSSDKNKIIISGDGKLIPMPGISISKHIGNSKFKVFVEAVFSQLERPKEFAVVLGLQGKQYQMDNIMGNIYGTEIEAEKIGTTTGLAIELIDRLSLENNDDYQGNTWILPIAD